MRRLVIVLLVLLGVYLAGFTVIGIKRSIEAARASETRSCGIVTALLGPNGVGYTAEIDYGFSVIIPTRQAYDRLKVGQMFTFFYRQLPPEVVKNLEPGEFRSTLIALEPGNACGK